MTFKNKLIQLNHEWEREENAKKWVENTLMPILEFYARRGKSKVTITVEQPNIDIEYICTWLKRQDLEFCNVEEQFTIEW